MERAARSCRKDATVKSFGGLFVHVYVFVIKKFLFCYSDSKSYTGFVYIKDKQTQVEFSVLNPREFVLRDPIKRKE
jgi:hypothetical protein